MTGTEETIEFVRDKLTTAVAAMNDAQRDVRDLSVELMDRYRREIGRLRSESAAAMAELELIPGKHCSGKPTLPELARAIQHHCAGMDLGYQEALQKALHALHNAGCVFDMVPTRLETHPDPTFARIGLAVSSRGSGVYGQVRDAATAVRAAMGRGRCPHCGDCGWVDDESWQPDSSKQPRAAHDGRIPCGACNLGGWGAPDVPTESAGDAVCRLEREAAALHPDRALGLAMLLAEIHGAGRDEADERCVGIMLVGAVLQAAKPPAVEPAARAGGEEKP